MPKKIKIILLFLLLLGVVYYTIPKIPTHEDDNVYYQEKFTISYVGDDVKSSTKEMLSKGGLYIFDFYKSINVSVPDTGMKVRFFELSSEFNKMRQRHNVDAKTFGYYSQTSKEMIIFLRKGFVKTFFHELSHFFVDSYKLPTWLDEGLATYLQDMRVRFKGIAAVTPDPSNLQIFKTNFNEGIDNKIEYFIVNESWSKESIRENYLLSWSVVFFILEKENGKQILEKIIKGFSGQLITKKSSKKVIEKAYPGGFNKFQSDYVIFYNHRAAK